MASYNELNALIDAYINRNGVQAITGQILNGVLKAMVEQLGRGYTIMGAAIPTTDPGTPDGPECYFASETGTYTDFNGLQIVPGELALLCYTPSDGWTKETVYEGFQEVGATIDGNVGTPSVGVSYANGVLSFDFHNMKGNPGQDGQDGAAAGFGTIVADITGGIGTPGVMVESSGPATAKNLQFHFTNLKGETGVTSVVATVDNTTGTPACAVSLVGQELHLDFTGLKGAQGNTGSSVDYPFTIVNNLTTDDATQALSAAMGVQLESEVSQLEAKVFKFYEETSYANVNYRLDTAGIKTATGGYELTNFIPVTGAKHIHIVGKTASTGRVLAFYSGASENDYISSYSQYSDVDAVIQSADFPAGTTHIRACSIRANTHSVSVVYSDLRTDILQSEINTLDGRITKNEGTIHLLFGASETLTPSIQRDGYSISGDGSIGTSANYVITAPIFLMKGQKLALRSYVFAGGTSLAVTDSTGTTYTPICKNNTPRGNVLDWTYIAPQDQYVAWCYLTTQEHSLALTVVTDPYTTDERLKTVESKENATNGLIKQVFGAADSIDTTIDKDNKSISSDGTVQSSANYAITTPIQMLKGQKITVTSYVPRSGGVQIATTDENGTSYTPVVTNSGDGADKTNSYVIPADGYVAISYLKTRALSVSITSAIDVYETRTAIDLLIGGKTGINDFNTKIDFEPKFIAAKKKAATAEPLVLLFFSDIHSKALVNLPRILDFYGVHSSRIDEIINLGDMVADQFSNDFVFGQIDGAENILNVIGNHDTATYVSGSGYDWTAHAGVDAYNKYIAPFVANWGVTQPTGAAENGYCYYYKDYATQGIRIVFLDVMAYDATEQSWLETVLADAKTNSLSVLIAAHNAGAKVDGYTCKYSLLEHNYAALPSYNNAITGAVTAIESFKESGGKFIAWVVGHFHDDIIGKLENTNQVCLIVDTAQFGSLSSSRGYDKVEGTRTQDAFSIVSIDASTKLLSTFKVGCRRDRWQREHDSICVNFETATILCEN